MNNWFDEHFEVVSFGADGKEDKEMAKGLKAGLKTIFENEYVKEPTVCERCEGTGKIKITFEEALTGEPAEKDPVYLPCSSCEDAELVCINCNREADELSSEGLCDDCEGLREEWEEERERGGYVEDCPTIEDKYPGHGEHMAEASPDAWDEYWGA